MPEISNANIEQSGTTRVTRTVGTSESTHSFIENVQEVANGFGVSRKDIVWRWGYNAGGSGGPASAGEHATYFAIENYYATSASAAQVELYLEHTVPDGSPAIRPFACNIEVAGGGTFNSTPYTEWLWQLTTMSFKRIDGVTADVIWNYGDWQFRCNVSVGTHNTYSLGADATRFKDGFFAGDVNATTVTSNTFREQSHARAILAYDGSAIITLGSTGAGDYIKFKTAGAVVATMDINGVFLWGTTVLGTAVAGETVLPNNRAHCSVNAAGSAIVRLIQATTVDQVLLAPGGNDIKWGTALVAKGGGAAPTLGTIGGSGPATALQNSWMRVIDSGGTAFWVPVWK
jgi:hypothetical protein